MALVTCATIRSSIRQFASSASLLSGHNKWSKIKEDKGANDHLKSKTYGRATRDILNAARIGDSADPTLNSALAAAIAKAKANGIPKANIQAALERARKPDYNSAKKKLQYEVLFAGKVGLIIECYSDNSTRMLRELKDILKSHEAQLAPVSYMFDKKAVLRVSLRSDQVYDELLLESLKNGALDLVNIEADDEDAERRIVEVVTPPDNLGNLTRHLRTLGYVVPTSELVQVPLDVGITLDDEIRQAVRALVHKIEENADVHHVALSPEL